MSMSKALQDLLNRLPPTGPLDFFVLMEAIERVKFTGPLTIDFLNGYPRQINLGPPVRLTICRGGANGTATGGPGGLDKVRPPRSD